MIIDACSGSGIVGYNDHLVDGSALRICEIVKKTNSRCILIESDEKTLHILIEHMKNRGFLETSQFRVYAGDCNRFLENLNVTEPTLVYIDPFGWGNPPIQRRIVLKLAENQYVDLLIHFSWRICRQIAFARIYQNFPPNTRQFKAAEAYKRSLSIYWPEWESIPSRGLTTFERAKKYGEPLQNYYQGKVQIIGLPKTSPQAMFFLIFATRQNLLKIGLEKFMM